MKKALQTLTLFLMLGFTFSSVMGQETQLTHCEWQGHPNRVISGAGHTIVNDTRGVTPRSITDDIEHSYSDVSLKSVIQYCDKEYFAGGSGTEADPWLIETAEHLDNIRYFLGADNSGKFFKQIAHIDLGVAPWNQGEGWEPIGHFQDESFFMGNYDGNGFTIHNLTINRPSQDYVGLFGAAADASINAIGLKDVIIDGHSNVGAISGYIYNTLVTKSFATGEIIAHGNRAGGLVGVSISHSIIDQCFANVDVFAEGHSIGGLAGTIETNSLVTNSYATGSVSGYRNIGGLAGWINFSIIDHSYATGYVFSPSGGNSGGLVGFGHDTHDAHWNIETTAQLISAGGVPKNTFEMLQQNIFNNYDFTEIWTIEEGSSYPYLSWQQQAEGFNFPPAYPPASYLRAELAETGIVLYWNAPSVGNPSGYNIYRDGYLIDFVNGNTSFTDSGLELSTLYSYYVTAVYDTDQSQPSNTISAFFFEGFGGGNGTRENPYLISTAEQLNVVRYYLRDHFKQIADIDLGVEPWSQGEGWHPIGGNHSRFNGSYDGDGFSIYNLTINRPEEILVGLFGLMDNGVLVQNLNFENASIVGNMRVGVLSGDIYNSSTIRNININASAVAGNQFVGSIAGLIHNNCFLENIHANAEVAGTSFVGGIAGGLQINNSMLVNSSFTGTVNNTEDAAGGLIGWLAASGHIHGSFSTADVNGNAVVGGLVGRFSSSHIKNSYASGRVTGQSKVGGLIGGLWEGWLTGEIFNNYSTGEIAGEAESGGLLGWIPDEEDDEVDFRNNYWDINSSGLDYSAAGEGLTTLQMLQHNSFVNWDFAEIWGIVDNITYPYLQWQGEPGPHNYPHLHELILNMQPPHGGSVEGAGDYVAGTQVSITATPNEGYFFISWTDEEGAVVSDMADHTFTMPATDKLLVANFDVSTQLVAEAEMSISIYPNPFGDRVNIISNQAIRSVLVYDMKGQAMLKNNYGGVYDISLSTGAFAKGIYVFITEDINGDRHFRRVVRN